MFLNILKIKLFYFFHPQRYVIALVEKFKTAVVSLATDYQLLNFKKKIENDEKVTTPLYPVADWIVTHKQSPFYIRIVLVHVRPTYICVYEIGSTII